jgi:hypothetical protein
MDLGARKCTNAGTVRRVADIRESDRRQASCGAQRPAHGARSLGLVLVGRRLFDSLRQVLVFCSEFEHPLLGTRVLEGLGFS